MVNSTRGTGLSFAKMTDIGIARGFDLQYSLADRHLSLYLCVGQEDNRVLITGTTPKSRQADVLKAIDDFGKWGEDIQIWMVSEKNGTLVARTNPINYRTHVKPYYGKLTIKDIAADEPKMTYPGNGKGRLLSNLINDRYYFIYGGKFETDNAMRGFDCTTFPMALLSIPKLGGKGYGKDVCEAVGALQCGFEQIKSVELQKKFQENTIPAGLYILFSEGHVLLYNSDINMLYEFTFGGFKSTPAGQRPLVAARSLWWMRKIDEAYRPLFAWISVDGK